MRVAGHTYLKGVQYVYVCARRTELGDPHEQAKRIHGFVLDDHAPENSSDLAGQELLDDMLGDLFGDGSPTVSSTSWGSLDDRAIYRLEYDRESRWASLTEFLGSDGLLLLREGVSMSRRRWYFNPAERRRGFVAAVEQLDSDVGLIVFILGAGMNPQISLEASLMTRGEDIAAMQQTDMDFVLQTIDPVFGLRK